MEDPGPVRRLREPGAHPTAQGVVVVLVLDGAGGHAWLPPRVSPVAALGLADLPQSCARLRLHSGCAQQGEVGLWGTAWN
jgi:hypothetical protein